MSHIPMGHISLRPFPISGILVWILFSRHCPPRKRRETSMTHAEYSLGRRPLNYRDALKRNTVGFY
ncbi:hypothetical protein GALMADRAFT_783373 [Galerina marginata CBS 339.88]|uniref:Uncharacterized protein n=1 Tax=Galerina marginata (strain CBS 339.88) TaxID=685588 RepID=A0A067SYL9_GALM3|nr:hypothetical protein GALMADRAFT_783373 [Galerina marginata CBS 339.88]